MTRTHTCGGIIRYTVTDSATRATVRHGTIANARKPHCPVQWAAIAGLAGGTALLGALAVVTTLAIVAIG